MTRASRWPIIVALVLLGATLAVLGERDPNPARGVVEDGVDEIETLAPDRLVPTASSETALSAAWFCAAGTATGDGAAEQTVVVANPTDEVVSVAMTVFGVGVEPTAAGSWPVEPGAQRSVRVADVHRAEQVAVLVEGDGQLVVEQWVAGPLGSDVEPCASEAASSWVVPWGVTAADATMAMAFFNPFPEEAVVDVVFATDDGFRAPQRYDGLVVPGERLLVVDVGEDVNRRDLVAAFGTIRSGRAVVARLQTFDGTAGRSGVDLGLAAGGAALTWHAADGRIDNGFGERIVIANPTGESAAVDVEIIPAPGADLVEPFRLTVPPEGVVELDLLAEERVTVPLRHGLIVQSTNEVPIVVTQVRFGDPDLAGTGGDPADGDAAAADDDDTDDTDGSDDEGSADGDAGAESATTLGGIGPGVTTNPLWPVAAERLVVVAAWPDTAVDAFVVIANPSAIEEAEVSVSIVGSGGEGPVDAVALDPLGRLEVPLAADLVGSTLMITASVPVVAELSVVDAAGIATSRTIPASPAVSLIDSVE